MMLKNTNRVAAMFLGAAFSAGAFAADPPTPPTSLTVDGAPAAPAETAAAATESAPAAAPAATSESAAAPTPTGTGKIIFFRPSKFVGAAVGYKVREGDRELGKLRNGTFFALDVPAGTHEYTVHSETKDVLTLEVEPGETYYVMGTLGMGVIAGRPNLSPSSQEAFDALKGKLKERPPIDGKD